MLTARADKCHLTPNPKASPVAWTITMVKTIPWMFRSCILYRSRRRHHWSDYGGDSDLYRSVATSQRSSGIDNSRSPWHQHQEFGDLSLSARYLICIHRRRHTRVYMRVNKVIGSCTLIDLQERVHAYLPGRWDLTSKAVLKCTLYTLASNDKAICIRIADWDLQTGIHQSELTDSEANAWPILRSSKPSSYGCVHSMYIYRHPIAPVHAPFPQEI